MDRRGGCGRFPATEERSCLSRGGRSDGVSSGSIRTRDPVQFRRLGSVDQCVWSTYPHLLLVMGAVVF